MNKKHLINLLYDPVKQYAYFQQLEKTGIEMGLDLDTYDIVCDIIGFPEIPTNKYNSIEDNSKLETPKNYPYCRDHISDDFFKIMAYASEKYNVNINSAYITFDQETAEQDIKKRIEKHIDFMYKEKKTFCD
jgi:hypothetical protein